MSDAVIISLIGSLTTTLGIIVVAWLNTRQNRLISKQSESIDKKVEDYHKEVNGKMGELLDTTKALGNAEGRAQEIKSRNKK